MKINLRILLLSMIISILLLPIFTIISLFYIPDNVIKETSIYKKDLSSQDINIQKPDQKNISEKQIIYKVDSLIVGINDNSYNKEISNTSNITTTNEQSENEIQLAEQPQINDDTQSNNNLTILIEPEYPDNEYYYMEQDEILQFKATPIPYWGYKFNIEIDGTLVVESSHSKVSGYSIGDPPICFSNYCYYYLYHPEFQRGWHDIKITNVDSGLSIEYNFLVVYRFLEYSYSDPSNSFEKDKEITIYTTLRNQSNLVAEDINIQSEFSDNVEIVRAVIYRNSWVNCDIQGQTVYAEIGDLNGWTEINPLGGSDILYITIKPLDNGEIINNVTVNSFRYNNYWGYYTEHIIRHTYKYEVNN